MQDIIGVIGSRTAGKTTFSKKLIEDHGFKQVPMAAALKKMLREGLGLTLDHTDGDLKQLPCDALCGKTPVQAMQLLGTEWGRMLMGEDLWLQAWFKAMRGQPKVIVDDVRFPNELNAIKKLGGVVVRIRRTGVEARDSHASELNALSFKADFEIQNNGTVEELHEKAEAFITTITIPK